MWARSGSRSVRTLFDMDVPCFAVACAQVEIKTTPQTVNPDVLQKAADFVHAFILGEYR